MYNELFSTPLDVISKCFENEQQAFKINNKRHSIFKTNPEHMLIMGFVRNSSSCCLWSNQKNNERFLYKYSVVSDEFIVIW